MNIAFISYEYPPDTADGGIATYVRQAAGMLARAGQHVEVFAASRTRNESSREDEVLVHRLLTRERCTFPRLAADAFLRRHGDSRFDVVEGPEYGADAREIRRLVPQVALVVKLHTPRYLVFDLQAAPRWDYLQMFREYAGAFRRGQRPWWHYDYQSDPERIHAADADEIAAPCEAIMKRVLADWRLESRQASCFPYPYTPCPELMKIPVATSTGTVTFLGRLERRKGIFDLARAIPLVLRRRPEIRFRLVGKCAPEVADQVRRLLGRSIESVELTGPVSLDEIPTVLAGSDLCVFPSLWENFALVCLEAMSAGRGVVASEAGGMAEMLDNGAAGLLVPPRRPKHLANQILTLLDDPELRIRLGRAARQRVLDAYGEQRVCAEQLASYARAIERRRAAGQPGPMVAELSVACA